VPPLTRIFSDLHFGDRASRVTRLAQLGPLLEGVDELVLNGDTLDTRPGPAPAHTAAIRAEVADFMRTAVPAARLLTGNHDADISPEHTADLADGRVFAVHGDVLFDDIVPWGRDAPLIGRLIAVELAALSPPRELSLEQRLLVWRRVAARIPQRHQSERHGLKYLLHFAADTIWPPLRVARILRAWRDAPRRAAELLRRHRPAAKLILTGHTHQPGCWPMADGVTVVNTGSFCRPLGGCFVDVRGDEALVRRVRRQGAEFRPGEIVARFAL